MKITDVRVRKVETDSKMKAVASITIDDVFVVHDIKIIDGDKGLFIAMPSKKGPMVNTVTPHIQSTLKQE